MATLTYSTTLTTLSCGSCEIPFAMPSSRLKAVQDSGESFWCPNGCKISYHETEADRLRKAVEREKRLRGYSESSNTALRDQLSATERSLRGHKAAKTRIKNRIAAGVCPCCNRQFQNLHRHMTGQHPDFTNKESN